MIKLLKNIFICSLFVVFQWTSHAQNLVNNRAEWFVNDRYGMFIHWGLYAGAEGIWKGESLRNDNGYAEWIQYRNQIPKEEYLKLANRFDWESINVEEWVLLAKEAGMKYITLTAKHHDGFALWDSKVSEYDIAELTNTKRDIVKELAQACKKHGLKMGLYYSHWIDWEHEFGWKHEHEIYPITPGQYDQYWQQKVIPQVRELLINYKVDLFWFDMWINHSETIVSKKQLLQLKNLIREIQPNCLVNSRLGLSLEEDPDVDFRTLGDNQLGNKKFDYPWQTPATVAHSWGFSSLEDNWKSTTTLLQNIVNNVALNGNLMLNIGPRANGDVPYEIKQRLLQIGHWLKANGESIYGAKAFDLSTDLHDWGKFTVKQLENGKFCLYAHIFNWPLTKRLPISGIQDRPQRVYLLADKAEKELTFTKTDLYTEISLPEKALNDFVSVVVLEYDEKPKILPVGVAKSVYRGYSLTFDNADVAKGAAKQVKEQHHGRIPSHVEVSGKQYYSWSFYAEKPTTFNIDASYSAQPKNNETDLGLLKIKVNGTQMLKYAVEPTGYTIVEPRNPKVVRFLQKRIGEFKVEAPQLITIELELTSDENQKIDFQWLWVEEIVRTKSEIQEK